MGHVGNLVCTIPNSVCAESISSLTETPCLFSSEQEDPRHPTVPVQVRNRPSLDPSDLGPLPVNSSSLKDVYQLKPVYLRQCSVL